MPEVVFVTAYDEYALRAFDAHATAYLLKPFSDEKFQATLDHALRHVRAGHAEAVMSQLQALLDNSGTRPGGRGPCCSRHDDPSIGSSCAGQIACGCCRSSRSAGSRPTACT